MKKHTQDKQLGNGSVVVWSRRNGERVPVICGMCGKKRIIDFARATEATFNGLCFDCSRLQMRAHTQDECLPTGSIIYWSQRTSFGRNVQVPVKCGICGQIRTMKAARIANNDITGYCAGCARSG